MIGQVLEEIVLKIGVKLRGLCLARASRVLKSGLRRSWDCGAVVGTIGW